jgi:hypothetical protein
VTQELAQLRKEEEESRIAELNVFPGRIQRDFLVWRKQKDRAYQNDLLAQVARKNARRREEQRKAIEEERQRRLNELEYDKKIMDHQERGHQQLMITRAQKPY